MAQPVRTASPRASRGSLARTLCLLAASGLVAAAASGPAGAQTRAEASFANDAPEDAFALRGLGARVSEPPSATTAQARALAEAAAEVTGTVPGAAIGPVAGRQNQRMMPVDELRRREADGDDALGIRAGRFIMRPALTQRIAVETNSGAGGRSERTYSRTEGAIGILSDWSRHQLAVDGSAAFEENLSGSGSTEPEADLDAVLRLDFANDIEGQLRAGYSFYREDETDPNAVSGANVQAGVHEFSAGAGLSRDIGLIRSSIDVDALRTLYGDARLADGSRLDLGDRDETRVTVTSRIGYAVSPALTPFLEAAVGRTEFDETVDRNGFERSAYTYALRTGVEIDLGEKWFGEIAAGYALREIDDDRLASIDAFTLDGVMNWSPLRGADVQLGIGTDIESSTTPELSGTVVYRLYGSVAHLVRSDITARLGGGVRMRDFQGAGIADQYIYHADAGLTWSINRYLALVADARYERTTQSGAEDFDTARIGLGLTLRR